MKYVEGSKNKPILGLHDLNTTFKINKGKFCTSVGRDSVKDME